MKKKLTINGMHCASCEVLIERKLRQVHGVQSVRANHATGEVELTCSAEPSMNKLRKAIAHHGYSIAVTGERASSNTTKDYFHIGSIFLILVAAYFILKRFDLVPAIGITDNMGYGFVFLIGLIAATSTCLAVTGGLLLAVAAKYAQQHPNLSGARKFKPHLYFNAGRIISYTFLGALLGAIGGFFVLSSTASGIITLLAAAIMIILGLQMLHVLPFLGKLRIRMPRFIERAVHDKASDEYKPAAPFILGASTFFLPCGFTQALQLYVLATGNWLVGGLTMLAFSLGTLPVLLGLGAITSWMKGSLHKHILRFAAVLVILLGVFSIPGGLTLVQQSAAPAQSAGPLFEDPNVELINGVQVIHMRVNGYEYVPSAFTLQKGVPVEWIIDGSKAAGCARAISVPKLDIVEYLPASGTKTIRFTPEQTGAVQFTCTMGMAGPGRFNFV